LGLNVLCMRVNTITLCRVPFGKRFGHKFDFEYKQKN
jgi:hypothetical protein